MRGPRRLGAVAAFCLAAIVGFSATRLDASVVKLAWNPNPESDIGGYRLHYGTRSGSYQTTVETSATSVTVGGLVEGRTYYFMVQAINLAGLVSAPSDEISYLVPGPPDIALSQNVFPDGLPLPWDHMDIGAIDPDATASVTSGLFTIQGSGTLAGNEDTARFVWQTLTGSGEIIARVSALENASDSSRIGVMIRDSLAANSKHVFFGVDGGGRYQWVRRNTPGGQPYLVSRTGDGQPTSWIRLKRSGDKITAYKSANGSKWKKLWKVSRKTLSLGSTCYIGFSVSSGSNTPCTATFSDVMVVP